MMSGDAATATVCATTRTKRGGQAMDFDDLGWGFWGKLAGIFVLGAIVLFILTLVFFKAVYAWGFLGTFLFIAVIALIAGWFFDRRNAGQPS
jgi:predicted lipid-binding transport protein (Tim44 family)